MSPESELKVILVTEKYLVAGSDIDMRELLTSPRAANSSAELAAIGLH
jgi:hypothetical protein